LIFFILIGHFFGIKIKGDLISQGPLSWSEIFQNLFVFIFAAILFTFFASKIYYDAQRIEKRDMDAARKRIEERERKEKEESQEKDNRERDKAEDKKL